MKTFSTAIFISLMIHFGCNTSQTASSENTEQSITGINWYLKKIYLPAGNMDITNSGAFIKFDAEKKSAGGKGGCNSFGSNYSMDGTNIGFKNIFSTKMFCEKFQQEENNFFMQLEKANKYELTGGKLLLYNNNELLLEFGK